MRLKLIQSLFAFLLLFCTIQAYSQTYTLSGYIKDKITGETLVGANIFNKSDVLQGVTSNNYGFYSLSLPAGKYVISVTYIGYSNKELVIDLNKDIALNIEMETGALTIQEIVVTAEPKDKNVQSTEMGTITLPIDNIKSLPAFMGEVDILRTLQLLPGVMGGTEGSTGFYVRGGGPDQNLVLLDEAVVYNAGHMMGFFSVFNGDAIKNTTLIKGGMPANFGGRLSSVVDVQMKEGNDKFYEVDGGIGAIASRLTIEGPIAKEKSSFIVSARRTYALDIAQPFMKGTNFEGTNYYFYDLNAKVNYRFSNKDRLYLSGYFGRDVFNFNSKVRNFNIHVPYGNATATLRWNHLFSDKLFLNVSAIYNDYDFSVAAGQSDFRLKVYSGVRDWNFKADFDYYPVVNHNLKFGLNYTYHRLTPNIASATNGEIDFTTNLKPKYAHEGAVYLLDDWKINNLISLNYGLRASVFTQVGPYRSKIDTTRYYKQLEPVKTYYGLEPRITGKFTLSPSSSIKAGVTLSNQYLHLVSNSASTLPTDVWVPSSELVKPQLGLQYALGYFRNFKDNMYEASVEVYYKNLWNQIDYPETYVESAAKETEDNFIFGKGRAYGIELFFKKAKGNLNGWIGYTLARTERNFDGINGGATFPATYDRTHDLVLVANYKLNKKWEFGGTFVYATGNNFTPIKSVYILNQNFEKEYGPRNSARYEPYHRLDFSATYTPKPDSKKRFTKYWTFSIYNVYSRLNPAFIYYVSDTDFQAGTAKLTAYKVALFPIIPSITLNFKWK